MSQRLASRPRTDQLHCAAADTSTSAGPDNRRTGSSTASPGRKQVELDQVISACDSTRACSGPVSSTEPDPAEGGAMEPLAPGYDAIGHSRSSVHDWRVSQLTRLGIPGSLAEVFA